MGTVAAGSLFATLQGTAMLGAAPLILPSAIIAGSTYGLIRICKSISNRRSKKNGNNEEKWFYP